VLRCRAIESEQRTVASGKHRHTATTAGACSVIPRGQFCGEGLTGVVGFRYPDLAAGFAFWRADALAVPRGVDISRGIRGHCPATIEAEGMEHQITLRLKRGALVVEPRVEHGISGRARFGIDGPLRAGRAGAIPGHVNASVSANCNLAAANGSYRDYAP